MGIGTSSEAVQISGMHADAAFAKATGAMAKAGKVIESDADAGFIRGTTRYGLQKVRLKINVEQSGEDSILNVEALGDDVWGKGGRSAIQQFRKAVEE
jgi:hypothetical protein